MPGSIVFFKQKTAYEMRISDWSSDVCSSDLADVQRALDRGAVAGDDHLPRRVVVGGGAYFALSRFLGDRFCRLVIKPEQRRHGPLADRNRRLHRSPAQLQQPRGGRKVKALRRAQRSAEHTSELQSLMRISYAVFCLNKKTTNK